MNQNESTMDGDDETSSNNNKKKRKARGGNKNYFKEEEGEDSKSSEPKPKKLRVKPERVKVVSEKILEELAKNYGWGMKEMSMGTLASNVGYTHPRSDAILEAMKLLKKDGLVQKSNDKCMFTDLGIEMYAPSETEIDAGCNGEEAMKQLWNQLENKLKSHKHTKGDKALDAAKNIWELLQDGNPHSIDEVLGVTTYGMERSTGFPEILKAN